MEEGVVWRYANVRYGFAVYIQQRAMVFQATDSDGGEY